ncbi:MAG: right-handed parallel beta-helix repeat-containing protein, partial [Thermodesulfobacteriota bacterium]
EADEAWSGEVILNARVTVLPGAVLTLMPGTRVAFRRVDPHGYGLGVGELLILGGIRSLGLPHAPVVFESAEPTPAPGDWDKVSLISAESAENEFRYTVFRHGTQALHAHFSSFSAYRCLFEANLRAGQFQESEDARLEGCVFVGNKQALRFRDSIVSVRDSVFLGNLYALHVFRCELTFAGNILEGSSLGGFLARESTVRFLGNRLARNRDGVRMREEGTRAEVRGNRFGASAEGHLSLSRVEGVVEGNDFEAAGLDLVSLEDSAVRLEGNRFGPSGRDAVHLKGSASVDARGNYWGPGPIAARLHDRADDPALGEVSWDPPLNSAPMLELPRETW